MSMPACYLIRKKLARIKFVLAGNNFGAIRLRRRVLSRSARMDRSGSRVVEREVSGVGKLVWETKMGGQTRSVLYQSCQNYGIIKVRGLAFQIPLFSAALLSVKRKR